MSHGLQHASHALRPTVAVLHAMVLFSWRQLCGTTHLQLAMHPPGDWVPCGSAVHSLAGHRVAAVHDGRLRRRRRRSAARDGVHLLLGQNPMHASVFYGESTCKTHRVGQSAGKSTCTTAARQLRPCANQQPAHTGGRGRVKWLVVAVET